MLAEASPSAGPSMVAGSAGKARRPGLDLVAQGKIQEALDAFRQDLETDPGDPDLHLDLGATLRLAGRAPEAAAVLKAALALRPQWPPALYNLGTALLDLGDFPGAAAAFRETAALRPDWSLPHGGLGFALAAARETEEAKAALGRALALDAGNHLVRHHLAQLHWASEETGRTVELYREGRQGGTPECQECHFALSLALLTSGEYAEGWAEYEWRWKTAGKTPALAGLDRPVWDGSPLAGRTIVLWAEQGLGDILMFVRFARLVHARGGRVWLLSRPCLDRLLATCPGVDRVVSDPRELGDYDCQAPLGSLPLLLGLGPDDLAVAGEPYLTPPALPRDPLGPRRGGRAHRENELRVGVVWGVEQGHPGWEMRSCPLPLFSALAAVPGVELYSLQFGPRAPELRQPGAPRMADLGGVLGDFASTAALVRHLDLVVTVDTSMAHLAGAIGQRVWTLLPRDSDWRWLRGREDTFWYPTMRLFRQGEGGWEEVLARVAAALAGLQPG